MTTNETMDKMNILKMAKELAREDVKAVCFIDIILVISFVACLVAGILQLQF